MSSTANGTFTCWDGYDGYELVEERAPRPPRRSRLVSTTTVPTSPRQGAERGGERQQMTRPTTGQGPREQEYTSLDELWSTLREKKHAAEAKLPLKVKSLEPAQAGSSVVSRFTPEQQVTTPRKVTPPKVKRKKSTYATASHRVSVVLILLGVFQGLRFISRVSFGPYSTCSLPSRSRDHTFLSPHRSPRPLTCPA